MSRIVISRSSVYYPSYQRGLGRCSKPQLERTPASRTSKLSTGGGIPVKFARNRGSSESKLIRFRYYGQRILRELSMSTVETWTGLSPSTCLLAWEWTLRCVTQSADDNAVGGGIKEVSEILRWAGRTEWQSKNARETANVCGVIGCTAVQRPGNKAVHTRGH